MFKAGIAEIKYHLVTDEGVLYYGELVYHKGETLEEYLAEYGIPNSWKYPIGVHDIFHDEININKYSCIYNEEAGKSEHIDWRRTVDEFIDDSDDDIVFVGIDYHI